MATEVNTLCLHILNQQRLSIFPVHLQFCSYLSYDLGVLSKSPTQKNPTKQIKKGERLNKSHENTTEKQTTVQMTKSFNFTKQLSSNYTPK